MNERRVLCVVAGVVSLTLAGQFVYSPVFATGTVKISIVEKMDDGSGELKPWQDIVGAMPGMSYSAIPQVKNDGEEEVSVRMCLSESATNASGEEISLPANTFGIVIGDGWALDNEGTKDVSDPAAGNCYKYASTLPADEMTKPLFTEVALSSELGNEFGNSIFNLHLEAMAAGEDVPPEEPDAPSSPDTGTNTAVENFVINSGLIFLTAGILALIVRMAYSLRKR